MITKDDIAALKLADSVTFHHYDGNGYLRAHLRNLSEPVIYTSRQQRLFPRTDIGAERHRHIVTNAALAGYKDDSGWWNTTTHPKCSAFHMAHSVGDELRTIFDMLRADDTVMLDWRASNNTDNHRDAGFHADELRLRITRGDKVMSFLIAVQVGPDNSARMIRRNG